MKITTQIASQIYIRATEKEEILKAKAVIFYIKELLDYRLDLMKSNFPANSLHAIAIKTCDHPKVLKHIIEQGFGLEAASFEEVILAKEAGADNAKIVFDSPVKTVEEILYCHDNLSGILLNANSINELERYPSNFNGKIGLRINPLVDLEISNLFNVSKQNSKFGVPLSKKDEIIKACLKYDEVACLHMHIGSDIKNFDKNILAFKKIIALAKEINLQRTQKGIDNKIDTIDIGGGIDFDLEDEKSAMTVVNFTAQINQILNDAQPFKLITEYGKFVHKDCSFAVSNIEYVIKNEAPIAHAAFLHLGADLFVRKVYSSLNIKYPYSIIYKDSGKVKENILYNIVGPLCFAGDVLYENESIPELQEGDKFVMYNIGANTYSMWSDHCNRKKPLFIFTSWNT